MANRMNVNPTRMQLKTLKNRLKIATRGHKLLKDKCDEMIRRYSQIIKKNYILRKKVESEVRELLRDFCFAKSYMSSKEVLSTFLSIDKTNNYEPTFEEKTIMNVSTPNIIFDESARKNNLMYSYINSNPEFDMLSLKCVDLMPDLIKLSSLEKTCQILSTEIEHTKRRVNALEFVMIPQLTETIKYISMKIEENDRSSRIRLIKVKSMIEKRDN